jgi:uncharacterized protein YbdZ (MbtH family)
MEKLGVIGNFRKALHMLQNSRTLNGTCPLDITPLLHPKPILTTHDGVDVTSEDTMIWIAYQDATNLYDPKFKNVPCQIKVSTFLMEQYSKPVLVFSTLEKCQSYIDQKWAELHPEPIFVTEDGAGMNKGDAFWYCWESGYCTNGHRDAPSCQITYGKPSSELYVRFSTHELAQAYLNKVWAETEYQSLLKAKQCQNK